MFIGQRHIIREVEILIPSGDNVNLLLLGQTGQGKTLLGFKIAHYTGQLFGYKIADNNDEFYNIIFRESEHYRTIFIDEIHRLGYDVERLYELMDRRRNFFIFATNRPQELPEAFRSRVIELLFAKYSKEELREITRCYLAISVADELLDMIIQAAEENPRRINQFCIRIGSIIRITGGILTKETLKNIIVQYFNIVDGMNSMEREYLSLLERIGTASLQTLTSSLGINKETIQTEIEPQLLFKGRIKITSKGREICRT